MSRQLSIAGSVVLALAMLMIRETAAQSSPNGPTARTLPGAHAFTRSALLERFDEDQDGELSKTESSRMRDVFGVDVPMLPARPYDYSRLDLPAYVDAAELDAADNTPADNPLTDDGATLGRVLFYDRQLSQNDTTACASCHIQRAAFTDPKRLSTGFQGRQTKRNSMSLVDLRFTNVNHERPGFFWDERAPTLEAQVLMPIQDEVEMGLTLDELERKLAKLPYYPPLFEAAFGSPDVTRDRLGRALAQFLRAMVSLDSKFDRAAMKAGGIGGDFADFTEQENWGKALFVEGPGGIDEFACVMCHVPPTFHMLAAANIGLELAYRDQGLGALGHQTNDPLTPSNDGKFKASSLRNVALTAPYMHDGRFQSLEQVLEHYSRGVHPHANLGLALPVRHAEQPTSGFQFSDDEKAALVAFLKTLTDEQFVSDLRFSDPFIRLEEP